MKAPNSSLLEVSTPARVAEPAEGVTADELALAARNHAMPLEALRYDITPLGLHYLLVHYDIPAVDAQAWRLAVGGRVGRALSLTLDELRALPARTVRVTMECAGNGRALLEPRPISQPWLVEAVGTAEWTGVSLRAVLDAAGVEQDAVDVVFTGADHGIERGVEQDYQRGLPLAEAMREEVLLAYEMNGHPLLPQHGHPVRLVVPGWYGMAHVKWLREIELVDTPFTGFQNMAYRLRQHADDPGEPATWIAPRALLSPPGFPDFMTRARVVHAGPVVLTGRAWSGNAPISSVEVSTDGAATWSAAQLDTDVDGQHRWAWQGWTHIWHAVPGRHVLAVRACDTDGNVQPEQQPWNRGGFANNAVHQLSVLCVNRPTQS